MQPEEICVSIVSINRSLVSCENMSTLCSRIWKP